MLNEIKNLFTFTYRTTSSIETKNIVDEFFNENKDIDNILDDVYIFVSDLLNDITNCIESIDENDDIDDSYIEFHKTNIIIYKRILELINKYYN